MRKVYILLLLLPLCFSCNNGAPVLEIVTEDPQLRLKGKWKLISILQEPATTPRLAADTVYYFKMITDKTFSWVIYEKNSGNLLQTAGGRYTLEGEKYTEYIEYVYPFDPSLMAAAIPFRCQLKDNQWIHSGYIENREYDSLINEYVVQSKYKLEEVWERVE